MKWQCHAPATLRTQPPLHSSTIGQPKKLQTLTNFELLFSVQPPPHLLHPSTPPTLRSSTNYTHALSQTKATLPHHRLTRLRPSLATSAQQYDMPTPTKGQESMRTPLPSSSTSSMPTSHLSPLNSTLSSTRSTKTTSHQQSNVISQMSTSSASTKTPTTTQNSAH
jgi:hypothetical protein